MDKNGSMFVRADSPPRVVRVTPVLRVLKAEVWEGWILAHKPRWVMVHWDPQQKLTFHHPREGPCKWCDPPHCLPKRYKGYLTVTRMAALTVAFLELTETGGEDLAKVLQSYDSWRGCKIRVKRKSGSSHRELLFEEAGRPFDPERLGPDEDPEPTLRRIWGIDVAGHR